MEKEIMIRAEEQMQKAAQAIIQVSKRLAETSGQHQEGSFDELATDMLKTLNFKEHLKDNFEFLVEDDEITKPIKMMWFGKWISISVKDVETYKNLSEDKRKEFIQKFYEEQIIPLYSE